MCGDCRSIEELLKLCIVNEMINFLHSESNVQGMSIVGGVIIEV